MTNLEEHLADFEGHVAEAEKASDALRDALKRVRKAARVGDLSALEKSLPFASQRAQEAQTAAQSVAGGWSFDAKKYLANGFAEELLSAAAAAGLHLLERDGKLYAFPLLLSVQPQDAAVKIGRKREREIRPKQLVNKLIAIQKKPQQLREAQLLEILYKAYQRIAGADWAKLARGPGPAISLGDIHALLVLLPSSDYPIEEYGRDLFLVDRKPDMQTRDGSSFAFVSSTLSKERGTQRISVYDEDGREHVYVALRFVKGP